MRLFNTLTQRVEDFQPQSGEVTLYVCGVTPYDTAHLGHAMVYATFDTLTRLLEAQGLTVNYTQNVTDIDDPLFEKAKDLGNITWDELARRETERFVREMSAINVREPDHFVRASDELPTMFALIQSLLDSGHAYESGGWIYFSVQSDPSFAQLAAAAGIDGYDALLKVANERGNDPADPRKRDPLDFLLWRAAVPGEPAWESPFGPGRPGWHIECSAMATRYLGPKIDIHGGGTDLIFPHHSCEIAQTENATGERPFVRYWMHVGMVGLNGTKMSKSLGNLVIVGQLLEKYSPAAIRLLLASHHYRQEWEYFTADMDRAQALADRLTRAAQGELSAALPPADSATELAVAAFNDAITNDLDTPHAIVALDTLADQISSGAIPAEELPSARGQLAQMGEFLGLGL